MLAGFGIEHTMLIMDDVIRDPSVYEKAIRPGKTKIVLFELITNPTTRLAPLDELCRISHALGVLTVCDATLAGFHQAHHSGIDVYLHSLTKFASGHGDVMGGAVLGRRELVEKVRNKAILLGPVLDPHAAYLIERGMKTYAVRFREASRNALELARRLEKHPAVEQVFYPGLKSHPDFQRLKGFGLHGFGCVLSFTLKGPSDDHERVARLIDGLTLSALAPSLGSTETLVTPVQPYFAGDLSAEVLSQVQIKDTTVRVSVGLEDVEDLWSQFQSALEEHALR